MTKQFQGKVMPKLKKVSLLVFKGLSAFCFSYVIVLIGEDLISYGLFSFIFLLISISLAFFYFIKKSSFYEVLILDGALVLLALLLRFYVMNFL